MSVPENEIYERISTRLCEEEAAPLLSTDSSFLERLRLRLKSKLIMILWKFLDQTEDSAAKTTLLQLVPVSSFDLHRYGNGQTWSRLDLYFVDPLIRDIVPGNSVFHNKYALLSKQWWQRMWVVQEPVVASKVMVQYNDDVLTWHAFTTMIDYLESTANIEKDFRYIQRWDIDVQILKALANHRAHQHALSHSSYGLLDLLYEYRSKESQDPWDKLYSLLGLVEKDQLLVSPDYSKSEEQVFIEFIQARINRYKSLLILGPTETQPNHNWYPEWKSEIFIHPESPYIIWCGNLERGVHQSPWEESFSAAGGCPAVDCIVQQNRKFLRVRGFEIDKIIDIKFPAEEQWFAPGVKWDEHIDDWRDTARTLAQDLYPDFEIAFHSSITAGLFTYFPEDEASQYNYCIAQHQLCYRRRFFVAQRCYFRLGPGDMKDGDMLR